MPVRKPRPKGPDVFSWALHQVVNLDHNYCGHSQQEAVTTLDHDNLTLNSVLWFVCLYAWTELGHSNVMTPPTWEAVVYIIYLWAAVHCKK